MWGLPAQASGSVGGLGRCLFARTLLHYEAARSRRSVDTEGSDKKEAARSRRSVDTEGSDKKDTRAHAKITSPAYILSSSMLVDRPVCDQNCFYILSSMEAVRVQYSRSFGGYLLQTSGLLRASRLKRTRQGEKNSLAGSKKKLSKAEKKTGGVEKKISRVEKKL